MKKLFAFHGGIHPPAHKTESTVRPIKHSPLPARLVLPMKQHAGDGAIPVVKVGDSVRKGQAVARSGATGRASGPHLHWSVYLNGVSVEPELFLAHGKPP